VSLAEQITDGKMHVKTCLPVKAYITQAKATIVVFRWSIIEQSNVFIKQVVMAYDIYTHCHNHVQRIYHNIILQEIGCNILKGI